MSLKSDFSGSAQGCRAGADGTCFPPPSAEAHLPADAGGCQTRSRRADSRGVAAGLHCPCRLIGRSADRLTCAEPRRQRDVSPLQSTHLHENRAAINSVAGCVELVAVEPGPTVIRRPVVDADDTEKHRRGELNARRASHANDFAGPGYQPDSLAVGVEPLVRMRRNTHRRRISATIDQLLSIFNYPPESVGYRGSHRQIAR
jgi:hypothetical protein